MEAVTFIMDSILRHCLFVLSVAVVVVVDEASSTNELQYIPPKNPSEAIRCLQVGPGLRVEEVAAEPLINDPIVMEFDEFGRAFVVDLLPYNQYAKPGSNVKGVISMLEDTDSDGNFDKRTIFADDLRYPTGIAFYDGGVFVGDAPDLLYLKDLDGDGRADYREVIFTGFGTDPAGEAQLNSFRWRFDNRICVSTGQDGGDVRPANQPSSSTVSVRNRNFNFDPRTRHFQLSSGGGQYGMSFDDWGRAYVAENSDPFLLLMYDDRYTEQNQWMVAPAAAVSVAPEGKFTRLNRISPNDPWRVIRTKLRAEGDYSGSDEGGKPSGYFTSASGVTVYRGDALPEDIRGNLFVGEPANNLVYRAKPESDNLHIVARRVDQESEFLASTDTWFRPVQFSQGPDGTLYVVDMYRELIEGAAFLPPQLLSQMDPTAGAERGRIYRIVPDDFACERRVLPGNCTSEQLVELIEHLNGWHRDTAARLLYERQDTSVVKSLRRVARASELPQARMHALYVLQSLKSLNEADVLAALDDKHPRVREHGVKLSETFALSSSNIQLRLCEMVADPDCFVRYQLSFSLGCIASETRIPALAKLIESDGDSPWFRMAVQSSLGHGASGLLETLVASEGYRSTAAGQLFLKELLAQIGRKGDAKEIHLATTLINDLHRTSIAGDTLAQSLFAELAQNYRGAFAKFLQTSSQNYPVELIDQVINTARISALEPELTLEDRIAAIRMLRCNPFAEERSVFVDLLAPNQPEPIQAAALTTIAEYDGADVAELIIEKWPELTPRLRATATESVLSRPHWIGSFLKAISLQRIPRQTVDASRVVALRTHVDRETSELIDELFPDGISTSDRRSAVVEKFKKALQLTGDTARGREVFRKVCSTCHKLDDVGTSIGPELKGIGDRGSESVLLNILDPNREVKPQYMAYVVTTDDGRTLSGAITDENAINLTICKPDGSKEIVLRANIEEIINTGLSYMPEGLERELDYQAMADLMLYLGASN